MQDGDEIDPERRHAQLLQRAKDGDEQATTAIYERDVTLVAKFTTVRVGRKYAQIFHELEDAIVVGFGEAFHRLQQGEFDVKSSLAGWRAWVARIVHHKFLDAQRHRNAERQGGGRERVWRDCFQTNMRSSILGQPGPGLGTDLARRELAGRIEDAILELDEPDRQALLMKDLLGMSSADIATELGVDADKSTVRSIILRARRKVAQRLGSRTRDAYETFLEN